MAIDRCMTYPQELFIKDEPEAHSGNYVSGLINVREGKAPTLTIFSGVDLATLEDQLEQMVQRVQNAKKILCPF